MAAIEQEILERISKLDAEKQQRVLEFVRSLGLPEGISGDDFVARAHKVNFAQADLEEIAQAIESGCERIESEDDVDLFA